jgi:type II secretory pathway component PulF
MANIERLSWLGRYFPRLRAPDMLRCLAVVIQAGRPVSSAIASLVAHHPDSSIRRNLSFVQTDVLAGGDVWVSLADNKLVRRAESAILASAQRAGNLPWALRNTADGIERKIRHRFQVVLEFFRPALMLALGSIVGLIVVALFMPLIKLINDFA